MQQEINSSLNINWMLLVPTGFTLAMITRLSEILSQHYTPKSIRQAINP